MNTTTTQVEQIADPSTATPVEIDTALAQLCRSLDRALHSREAAALGVQRCREATPPPSWLPEAQEHLARATSEVERLLRLIAPLDAEYQRRPWTRAFIVQNTNGHIHSSRACATCYPTTDFGWLPQISGFPQGKIIELAGEMACTVCYPDAPVETRSRPCQLDTPERLAERDAKAAEKAERARVKAAKAITAPDGSPLRDEFGLPIATEVTAQNTYVTAACDAILWREHYPAQPLSSFTETGWAQRCARNADEHHATAERLLAALAHKRNTTLDEQRDLLAPKVAKKVRTATAPPKTPAAQGK